MYNEFDSEPVYNEKSLKAEINSCNGKSTQAFIITKYQKTVPNLFVSQ